MKNQAKIKARIVDAGPVEEQKKIVGVIQKPNSPEFTAAAITEDGEVWRIHVEGDKVRWTILEQE